MDEHEPVDETESQFLEREADLVSVVPRKPSSPTIRATASTAVPTAGEKQSAAPLSAITFPLVLVLPLMAFAIVPSLLGRCIVIALMVAVASRLVVLTPKLLGLMAMREWSVAATM